MQNKHLPLVETIAVPDVYVSGLADIEPLGGGVFRFTFYAVGRSTLTGEKERAVVGKIVTTGEIARSVCAHCLDSIEDVGISTERIPLGVVAH